MALTFADAQTKLAALLAEFGPPVRTTNVIDPFWRLQNDGIWRVESATGGRIAGLLCHQILEYLSTRTARGNFVPEIAASAKRTSFMPRLGRDLLAAHFPSSLHEDICAAVGLEAGSISDELISREQLARDAEFRPRIIRAYEHRCAVTGWDLRISNANAGWKQRILNGTPRVVLQ